MTNMPYEALFVPEPSPEKAAPTGIPATLVQLNLITDGLILGLPWHHSVGDGPSASRFLGTWARHTKTLLDKGVLNDPVVPNEAMRARWRLSYGTRGTTVAQFPECVVDANARSPESEPARTAHLLDCADPVVATTTIAMWYFSPEALQALRSHLASAEGGGDGAKQFTNSAAVSALVWKHMSRARRLHDLMPEKTSFFSTWTDFRGWMRPALNEGFIGNVNQPCAATRFPVQELCTPSTAESVAELARLIRSAVEGLDEAAMRDYIGVVEQLPSVTDITCRDTFPGPSLSLSDNSRADALRQDWGGPLGYPVCIRTGSFGGVAYSLPRDQDGGGSRCSFSASMRLSRD